MSVYGSQHGEVAAFIESIPSLTAGDWLVPALLMSSGSSYNEQAGDASFQMMAAINIAGLWSEMSTAQVHTQDAVRSLVWPDEEARAQIAAAAHLAVGVAVARAGVSTEVVSVAFDPFRTTSVRLPGGWNF